MNLLLDTHVVLWWLDGGHVLNAAARDAIADPANGVWVSAASMWEVAVKAAIGKLRTDADIPGAVLVSGFEPLPITFSHAESAGGLPAHHRDPFDRMLIAQAQSEGLVLVTRDRAFEAYEVARMNA